MTVKIVTVENIAPALKATYGLRMHVTEDKALIGEARGKWRIIRDPNAVGDYASAIPVNDAKIVYPTMEGMRGLKKIAVAWVQDNNAEWTGGAEFSNAHAVAVGMRCGFKIRIVTPQAFDVPTLQHADIIVLNNLFRFSVDQIRMLMRVVYEQRVPYIKYEHDHRELGRPEFSRKLFEHSVANVFISPAHRDNHHEQIDADGECFPLAIDTEMFRPVPGIARKPGTALVLNVRVIKTWKHLSEYIAEHATTKFTVVGNGIAGIVRGRNVNIIPPVSLSRMPELYSAHESLVHLPDNWCAGERIVLEAALCGCKIIANKYVGHMSWDWDLTDADALRERLINAPYDFWRMVDHQMIERVSA